MHATVNIQVKYLSAIRDKVGYRDETAEFQQGATLEDVNAWLNNRYCLSLPDSTITVTLNGRGWNQLPQKLHTELGDGDVICIFPILSGG